MCISIEEFDVADVLDLKTWGIHEDLRYVQYGFDRFYSDDNFRKWHEIKTRKKKKLFAIKESGKIRGYISLREINKWFKSAVLGISIDPNYLSKGIGSYALTLFLKLYFEEMKMNYLSLKVSHFNERAINLYESLGFVYKKTRLESFENQMDNFQLLLHYPNDFRQIGEYLYTDVSQYIMTKSRYEEVSYSSLHL